MTSVGAGRVTSVTVVDVVKATVALPFSWVTAAVPPDTDAISPLIRAWPVAGAAAGDVDVVAV
jgi:hypothetical protein